MPKLITVKRGRQQMAELYHRAAGTAVYRPDEGALNRLVPELMPAIQHPVILEAVTPPDERHGFAAAYDVKAIVDGRHHIQYTTSQRFLERNLEAIEHWSGLPGDAGLSAVLWHELTHAVQAERLGMSSPRMLRRAAAQHGEAFGGFRESALLRELSPTSWMEQYVTIPDEAEAFARARDLREYSIATLIGGLEYEND